MNWQLVSFFGDSTVLLPSAVVLFAVLALRKSIPDAGTAMGVAFWHYGYCRVHFKTGIYGLGRWHTGNRFLLVSADIPRFLPLFGQYFFMAVNLTGDFLRPL